MLMNRIQRDTRLGVGEEDERMKQGNVTSVIVERLSSGRDILEGLNELVDAKNITGADFTAIGAVSRAVVGFFVGRGQYSEKLFEGPLEIVSCVGNVSVKENQPFIHAHISLADHKGNVFGGHLLPGCQVAATFEVIFHVHDTAMNRTLDSKTGLFLLDT